MTIINTTTQNLPELASVTEKVTAFPTEVRTPEGYDGMDSVTVTAPDNLEAENIKRGVTIAGVTGTYTPKLQDKSVTPETLPIRISPDSGYSGLEGATVNKPAELLSTNIRKGATILGYTGTYETPTETKTVTPTAFPVDVTPETSGYHLSQVTVNAPANLSSDNIRKDAVIAGVTGTYETPTESRAVTPDSFPTTVVPAVEGYHLAKVTVNKPSSLVADNIRNGATIAGITGTYETPTAVKNVTPEAFPVEVTPPEGYVLTKVTVYNPSGLVESNIKKGETIAGITGTYVTPSVSVTDTPDQFPYVITSPQEDKLLSEVTVDAPVNFTAENIKKGVSIAGVEGTYEGSASDTFIKDCMGTLTELNETNLAGATSIRPYMFYSGDYDTSAGTFMRIKTVSLPSTCPTVGARAFSGAPELTSFSNTGSVVLNQGAFSRCKLLSSVNLEGDVTYYNSVFESCNAITEVDLSKVTSFTTDDSSCLFSSCTGLTTVTLPQLERVPLGIFSFCSNLANVRIPDTVRYIDDSALRNCSLSNLTGAKYVTDIGNFAFTSSKLTSFPGEHVQNIGMGAFSDCTKLTTFTSGETTSGTYTIGSTAFRSCTALTSVDLSNTGYISIGNYVFSSCYALTSVKLPDSLETIGDYAFYLCTNLAALTVPENVTSIGAKAFASASSNPSVKLTLTLKATTPPALGTGAFDYRTGSAYLSIIVPKGTLATYKSATNWSSYASYMTAASE